MEIIIRQQGDVSNFKVGEILQICPTEIRFRGDKFFLYLDESHLMWVLSTKVSVLNSCRNFFRDMEDAERATLNNIESVTLIASFSNLPQDGLDINEVNEILHRSTLRTVTGTMITFKDIIPVSDSQRENTRALELIYDEYEDDLIFQGKHSYHHYHGEMMNEPLEPTPREFLVGVELELECRDNGRYEDIRHKFKSNVFMMERDGSLNDFGIEFITVPLRRIDAVNESFWDKFVKTVGTYIESIPSPLCGLHVHLSRCILGDTRTEQEKTLGKLLYFYNHIVNEKSAFNTNIFGRSRGYRANECKTSIGDACSVLGNIALRNDEVLRILDSSLKTLCYTERYFDINIQNKSTIEFRRGRATTKPDRIVDIINYCISLCEFCRKSDWASLTLTKYVRYVNDNANTYGARLSSYLGV
jgi:hypothetical protein